MEGEWCMRRQNTWEVKVILSYAESLKSGRPQWCTPLIPTCETQRQEDLYDFQAGLDYNKN